MYESPTLKESFHPLWAGLSFQRYIRKAEVELKQSQFPSPLGGSQFSKPSDEPGGVWSRVHQFPSPLGGSQFSKII